MNSKNNNQLEIPNDQEQIRKKKLEDLKATGNNPYHHLQWLRTDSLQNIKIKFEQHEQKQSSKSKFENISLAGRLMTKRNYGKICFGNIKDESGTLQIMGLKFPESENALITLKNSNLGDILGVTGQIARIESGEITLKIFKCVILAKCLKVLPDKHSKLVDEEMRYRQRYLDLIVNSEVMTIFRKRSQIISAIRNFMNQKNYLEVEVPILQPVAGGANARPFVTFYNSLHQNYYLRIATELHLKRLIVGGFEGVYEIGRIFRNEGLSPKHNPEFTSMEFYAAYQNLEFGYQFTEELWTFLLTTLNLPLTIKYQDQEINFQRPWKRISMIESIFQVTGVNFNNILDFKMAQQLAIKKGLEVPAYFDSVGHIITLFFEQFVEETLIQPTFVYDFPVIVSPLAKRKQDNPQFAERFELYINGMEYANAFGENNDPDWQLTCFSKQLEEKNVGNEEIPEVDHDFIEALRYGMPPTMGIGIGIDRLIMLLTNQKTIKEVILFPQLKSK